MSHFLGNFIVNTLATQEHTLKQIESELSTIKRRVNKDQWRTAELLAEARDGHFKDNPKGFNDWMHTFIIKTLADRWLKVYDRFSGYEEVARVMKSENPIDFSKLAVLRSCDDGKVVQKYIRLLIGPNPPLRDDIQKALNPAIPISDAAIAADGFDQDVSTLKAQVAKAMPKGTSKAAITKTARGVENITTKLKQGFQQAVERGVEKKTSEQRVRLKNAQKKADDKWDRAVKLGTGVKAFMTKEEFILVRKCLHPDTNPHPKAAEAFAIFNRLADVKKW